MHFVQGLAARAGHEPDPDVWTRRYLNTAWRLREAGKGRVARPAVATLGGVRREDDGTGDRGDGVGRVERRRAGVDREDSERTMDQMTVREFAEAMEQYYGPYPRPAVKALVAQRVATYTDEYRSALYEALLLNVSSRFDRPPDIAEIVKHDAHTRALLVDRKRIDKRIDGQGRPALPEFTAEEHAESAAAASAMVERLAARRRA